jgi:tRNA pseudouridine32 synthase/23S rRNA pseudouridine746 synthase
MDIPILYADAHVVVLNKPAGLAVHPGPGGGPSVEDMFPTLSRRADGPWLAHRLDADTSGCLVVALRKAPLLKLQAAFAAGAVRKTYWAVVAGDVAGEQGTIAAKLIKRSHRQGWSMAVDAAGQDSVTDWRVLGRAEERTWLELSPRTGRTHQLRVHCAHAGWPILGDALYGTAGPGLHLLARRIVLPLDPAVDATAPPPSAMLSALAACGSISRSETSI